jgi:hypothetical protein
VIERWFSPKRRDLYSIRMKCSIGARLGVHLCGSMLSISFSDRARRALAVRRVQLVISVEGGVDITSLSIATGVAEKLCACAQDLGRH